MISSEEFDRLANLSKLEFSAEEKEKFMKEFSSIVEFASKINEAEVENQTSFIASVKLEDLREDVACAGLSQDEVVSNAPMKKNGAFVVPRIMD